MLASSLGTSTSRTASQAWQGARREQPAGQEQRANDDLGILLYVVHCHRRRASPRARPSEAVEAARGAASGGGPLRLRARPARDRLVPALHVTYAVKQLQPGEIEANVDRDLRGDISS